MPARHLAQADDERPHPLPRPRVAVVEDRAVGHVPELAATEDRARLCGNEGDDRAVVVGEHEAALRLAVEGGDIGPGPVVQEVAGIGSGQEGGPGGGVRIGRGAKLHQTADLRRQTASRS